jgi:hypothetical protein
MKELDGLRWVPRWTSHMGCLKGCLDYLGVEVSDAWLYGATGHAFVINMHEVVCPSGPTAWHTGMIHTLAKNVGCEGEVLFATTREPGFAEAKERAWETFRSAIDEGTPCYGWELAVPEFYVLYGYDEVGYHFSGCAHDEGAGPKPWQELGDTGIGCLELVSVREGTPADDAATVRDALAFALEHAGRPSKWIFPGYASGLGAYDTWVRSVEAGTAVAVGMGYNSQVWAECRMYGVGFLEEAGERLSAGLRPLLGEAARRYREAAESLREVAATYPFTPGLSEDAIGVDARTEAVVVALRRAREAEAAGLDSLAAIVASI